VPGPRKKVGERRAAEWAEADHVLQVGLAAALQGRPGDQQLELSVLNKEMPASRKAQRGRQILAADCENLRVRRRGHHLGGSAFLYLGAVAGGGERAQVHREAIDQSCDAAHARLNSDILALFCPTRQEKFAKYEIRSWAEEFGYCAWGCFWFLAWRLGPHVLLTQKKGRLDGRPFRSGRNSAAYSAACFCGGSSAPDLWISATW